MRINSQLRLLALVLLSYGSSPLADENRLPIPADEFVYCTVCHGVQLMGNSIIEAPRLSEMESWYVERQMRAYKNGWRGAHEADVNGLEMQPMAADLSDAQIAEVAEYVNATRSELPPQTIAGDAAKGEALYGSCAACHGAEAEGNQALGAPALRGLDDWYLVTQLENFRNGVRGGNSVDTWGVQMAAATVLSDGEAIHDVVKYITNLPTN
jgi:cytochrome c oxidase subunit 2